MTTTRKISKKPVSKPKAAPKRSLRAAMSIAVSEKKPDAARISALAEVPLAVCKSDKDLQAMLALMRNSAESPKVRLAAMQSIQAASFSVIAFESCRGDFTAALRAVATDADPEIRQRALGLLAREQDGYAQKKLLEGLENPEKALVPPEKALQLLSYDPKANVYSQARKIVTAPPNPEAKTEALRLLAADARSATLFESVLMDKEELKENRQISASALQSLRPDKFQSNAKELVLDNQEYDDIQATALTALTQFGDEEDVSGNKELLKSITNMSKKGSAKLKKGASRFLDRYVK